MGQHASNQEALSTNQWSCRESKCSTCCNAEGNELIETSASSTADPYEDVVQMRVPFAGMPTDGMAKSTTSVSGAQLTVSEADLLSHIQGSCKVPENLLRRSVALHNGSLEWLNWLFTQLWPNISKMLKRIVLERIEPEIQKEIERFGVAGRAFKGMKFSHFDIGDAIPTLGPIKAYRRNAADFNGIEIDCGMHLDCEPLITLDVAGYHIGIQKLTFEGQCSVILKPLLDREPLIGGVQCFLLKRPHIEFEFTGLPTIVNGSLLYRVTKKVALDQIAKMVVIPNRFTISLVKEWQLNADIVAVQYPRPEGIIRILIKEAANLPEADIAVSSFLPIASSNKRKTGNSDPYCLVHVGSQILRTPTIQNNCSPKWPADGSIADFFVYNVRQPVEFEVYDDDFGLTRDDLLGKVAADVRTLVQSNDHTLRLKLDGNTSDTEPSESPSPSLKPQPQKSKGVMSFVKSFGSSKSEKSVKAEDRPTLSLETTYLNVVEGSKEQLARTRSADRGPNEALLTVSVYGMRPVGVQAKDADAKGMRLRLSIRSLRSSQKDSSRLTKPCTVRADNSYERAGVKEAVVKIAQNLQAMQPQMSAREIAEALEIEESTVNSILGMKQIMPLVFNEGLHFLLPDVSSDVCVVELMSGENKSMHPVASIELPVASLLEHTDCVISRLFSFDALEQRRLSLGGKERQQRQSRGRFAFFSSRSRAATEPMPPDTTDDLIEDTRIELSNSCLSSSCSGEHPQKSDKSNKEANASRPESLKYEVGLQFQLWCFQAASPSTIIEESCGVDEGN